MFENIISGSCDWYEREMLAKIEKQEEAAGIPKKNSPVPLFVVILILLVLFTML